MTSPSEEIEVQCPKQCLQLVVRETPAGLIIIVIITIILSLKQ